MQLLKYRTYYWINFILILIVFQSCKTQDAISELGLRGKILNYEDSVIRLNVLTRNKSKEKVNNELQYYWLNVDRVNNNMGGYYNNVLHGNYTVFDKAKRLITQGEFNKGIKVGEWKLWYGNGNLKTVELWKNGLREGKQEIYASDGTLIYRNSFKEGKLDGICYRYEKDTCIIRRYKNGILLVKPVKNKVTKPREPVKPKIKLFRKSDKSDQKSGSDKKQPNEKAKRNTQKKS